MKGVALIGTSRGCHREGGGFASSFPEPGQQPERHRFLPRRGSRLEGAFAKGRLGLLLLQGPGGQRQNKAEGLRARANPPEPAHPLCSPGLVPCRPRRAASARLARAHCRLRGSAAALLDPGRRFDSGLAAVQPLRRGGGNGRGRDTQPSSPPAPARPRSSFLGGKAWLGWGGDQW